MSRFHQQNQEWNDHERHEHQRQGDGLPNFSVSIHNEIGGISYQQAARYHHEQMGRVQGYVQEQRILPYMEVPRDNYRPHLTPDRRYESYSRPDYGNQTNYYSRPNSGRANETSYYPREQSTNYYSQRQGQLEFTDPYQNQQRPHHEGHHHRQHHRGHGGGTHESSIYTYDGAVRSNPAQAMASTRVVAEVARRMGVDPVVAVAAMLVESGGNPHAVGDHGHSFGLFQLNSRGELKQAHLTPQQAFDPATNAEVALSYFRKGHVNNPGAMAAAAQRPANRGDYARKVNSNMAEAERMVHQMGLA